MHYTCLYLAILPSILAFQYNKKKFAYHPGTICNYDILPTTTSQLALRYYCVPKSQCNLNRQRSPIMPQSVRLCNEYITAPQADDALVCCHNADINDINTVHWDHNKVYLPGLRSWLMCRDHAQALCSSSGENLCSKDFTNPDPIQGIPSVIEEYPHTALIGYKLEREWDWNCLGSIISRRFVLTAGKCGQKFNGQDLFVKLGESLVCDTCPDHPEEQVIKVRTIHKKFTDHRYYLDFALLELDSDIRYNRLVRPACLLADPNVIQSQGWFAQYGQIKRTMVTEQTSSPETHPLTWFSHNGTTLSFRVKCEEEVGILYISNGKSLGLEQNLEIVLGAEGNTKSFIRDNGEKTIVDTNVIVNPFEYRGFWIQLSHEHVAVGREDEIKGTKYTKPFMERNIPNKNFSTLGIGSPKGDCEWIFPADYTLFNLRDSELEVTYKDRCQEYYNGSPKLDKDGLVDELMFCAGNIRAGKTPCDNDWGGAIQVADDNHYCMWQIFGVYAKDDVQGHTNCSKWRKPAVFNSITPMLEWIENIVFKDFAVESIAVDTPECTLPDSYRQSVADRC